MKKLFSGLIMLSIILSLGGCVKTAKTAVEDYLAMYTALDEKVLSDMENIVETENLTDENKSVYEAIFKKQYQDLSYEITNEEYSGDEATITAKISVYDLYKAQNDANNYLSLHPDEFNDEKGVYDVQKFFEYKLEQMKNTTDKVEYTIDFYVVKTGNNWVVSSLSNTDLEKIHGIYDYEA